MKTFYIRHTKDLNIDDETREKIWKQHRIAIHFPYIKTKLRDGELAPEDNRSLDPMAYRNRDARYIQTFRDLSRDGGYVCAEYYPHDRCAVGFVKPGSRVRLIKGKYSDGKRVAILKTLLLGRMQEVPIWQQPSVLIGRPRQGTISEWHSAGKRIERRVEEVTFTPELDDLLPSQQETLCSEFLRAHWPDFSGLPRLAHLFLPVGRTLKDIDVYGLASDGKDLLAQVTHSGLNDYTTKRKLESLSEYSNSRKNHLVLFCRCRQPKWRDAVLVFPIQRAFIQFTSTETGRKWLDKATASAH